MDQSHPVSNCNGIFSGIFSGIFNGIFNGILNGILNGIDAQVRRGSSDVQDPMWNSLSKSKGSV